MDLWQMVTNDHANIEELCREVLHATGSGPNSRAELFADLQDELERHIAAQQNVIYPALSGHERTASYVADLESEQEGILRRLDELAARPDKDGREWATDFKELMVSIRHVFTLEENGVMIVARGIFSPSELKELRRSYERERIASYESNRWHLPQSVMPSRYGLPTGTVFGILAGVAAIGTGALLWSMNRSSQSGSRQNRNLRPAPRRPEPPFPLDSGVIDRSLEGSRTTAGRASSTTRMSSTGASAASRASSARVSEQGGQQAGQADDALLHGAGTGTGAGMGTGTGAGSTTSAAPAAGGSPSDDNWFSSANPPRAPSGLSTPLQPGGTLPAGGPATSAGSIGTGGAPTGGADTGGLKRDGV